MIKGSIQDDITILNIYAPNTGSPQYIRQLLTTLKGQIDHNTIRVGDFNILVTAIDRSTRQKINKETQALHKALDQMDLIDIYRTFHPKAAEYTHSSQVHMEHFLRLIISWATNKASVTLRKLKSYQASFLTTTLYDWKSTTRKNCKKKKSYSCT